MEKILKGIEEAYERQDLEGIVNCSSKFKLLMELMQNFRKDGHRVLIFSMSKKNLDLLEQILEGGFLGKDQDGQHVKYMRIDGDTEIADRE